MHAGFDGTFDGRFDDKVALVTGGGSGIGRAVALRLAAEGAAVAVAGRRPEPLAETVAAIAAAGGRAIAVPTDVADEAAVARLVATTAGELGGLDVAVNNAGTNRPGPLADLDAADWQHLLDVNLTGVWLSMKHEIGHMRGHGGGSIVNVASNIGAHARRPAMGGYAATKAAVSALTRNAALEYVGDGIRINAVSPGPSDTPLSLRPGESAADRDDRLKHANPSGRVATLAEIADAVLWLAAPTSAYVVGHDLVIDGGATA